MVMKFDADSVGPDANLYAQAQCRFWAEQGFGVLSGPYPTPTASRAGFQ
jgi:para-nitrobenzyl esterase